MKFLRNTWYVAAWAEDVNDKPVGRRIINEPVVLYRTSDGTAVAIGDRCPHRFAPLHLGKIVGDAIQCPYHGLEFGASGRCTRNPHGDGKIPAAAQVKSYPLVERHDALWIWMGDAALADPSKIVDVSELTSTGAQFKTSRGYLSITGNYQLVTDNLLDLSHGVYLHPAFQVKPAPDTVQPVHKNEMKQEGNTIWMYFWNDRGSVIPFYAPQWGDKAPKLADSRVHMRWDAPSILQLDTGMTLVGGDRSTGPSAPSLHLLTPETEHTTHYFWSLSHDWQTDNPQISAMLKGALADAFEKEDEPMISACYDLMGRTDLMELNPVLLPGDTAAIRARRVLAELIERENSTPA